MHTTLTADIWVTCEGVLPMKVPYIALIPWFRGDRRFPTSLLTAFLLNTPLKETKFEQHLCTEPSKKITWTAKPPENSE